MLSPVSLLVLALLSIVCVDATDYYLSSSLGSDRGRTGLSPAQAWKTMQQVYSRAYTFQAGDTINFCQGDRWMFTNLFAFANANANNPITWKSYKCGTSEAKPIISPAVTIANNQWVNAGDALTFSFARDTTATSFGIRAIWAGSQRHLPARFPSLRSVNDATLSDESEFIWNSPAGITESKLRSPRLSQPANYWVGATVYMRISNWLFHQSRVTASGPGWIQIDYKGAICASFYIEQSMNEFVNAPLLAADAPGEYVFNRTNNQLYFYPSSPQLKRDILSGATEVNFLYGNSVSAATITGNNHVIQDLEFKWTMSGILNTARAKFIARRNTIKHAVGWGVTSTNSPNSIVDRNIIEDAEADCVLFDGEGGLVSNNQVNGCGMYAGYGFGYGAATSGIVTISANVVGNTIRNTGYSGITPHRASKIADNHIVGVMKTLNDGGGIYMYGAGGASTSLENNLIEDVTGNYLGWTPWNIASCVFTDQGTSSITIYNNTCKVSPQCMQLNSAYGNLILSNQCESPGIYMNDYTTGNPIGNHGIIGNVVITRGTHSRLQNPIHRIKAPGRTNLVPVATFFQNRYCQGASTDQTYLSSYVFQKDFGENGVARYDTFAEWQQSECQTRTDCTFEQYSIYRYNNCDQLRPWFWGDSIESMRESGHILLAQEASDQLKYIVGGCIGGVALIGLLVLAVVMYVRHSAKKQSMNLTLPTSSPINQSFGSNDSPASGEFELVVTPEIQRAFSWSAATIQNASA